MALPFADQLPDLGITGGGIINVFAFIFIGILIAIVAVGVTIIIVLKLKFNKKIIIFEKINGRFEPTRKDRGMIQNLKGTGDTILYLKKFKKYLPTPELQTGRNTYWFAIREDGEWFNIGIEDIDDILNDINQAL